MLYFRSYYQLNYHQNYDNALTVTRMTYTLDFVPRNDNNVKMQTLKESLSFEECKYMEHFSTSMKQECANILQHPNKIFSRNTV